MNKQILLFCLLILFAIAGSAQTVTLTFTGRDGANKHVEMNYVSVSNVTKGWQVLLPWPDTVLTLQNQTGIHDVETAQALSLQMSPNPFDGITDVVLSVPEDGIVRLEIADMSGRMVETFHETSLQPGAHQFRISLAFAGTYLLTAHHNGQSTSLKMVCHDGGSSNTIQYVGIAESFDPMPLPTKSQSRGLITRPFDFGDQMEFVGVATINDEEEESQPIEQPLWESQTFVLQFSAIQLYLPTVITANVTGITDTSAICGGEVTDDGGDTATVRGVCISISPSPTVYGRHTVEGSGMGPFSSHLSGLISNFTYYVRAYATNSLGTAYGEEKSFTIPINPNGDAWSCPGAPSLVDIDGNVYNTVQIGQQCWMRENLRTTRYADGTPVLEGESGSTTIGHWYYPMNVSTNMYNYGLLYNWSAVMRGAAGSTTNPSGVQGLCPNGWHVPSDAECTQLFNYLKSQSQYWCGGDNSQIGRSLAATVGWDASGLPSPCVVGNDDLSHNNAARFGALPAGFYDSSSTITIGSEYGGLGYVTFFWTATGTSTSYGYNNIYYWGLHTNYALVMHNDLYDSDGEARSVRCVKD